MQVTYDTRMDILLEELGIAQKEKFLNPVADLTPDSFADAAGYKQYGLPRPGMMFLGYPVISMIEKTHGGSRRNLLGEENENDPVVQTLYSVERQVTADYPPTFIWQCDGDKSVPVEHSGSMVRVLQANQVPYRHEEFHAAAHSWGLGTGTAAEGWLDRAVKFWDEL